MKRLIGVAGGSGSGKTLVSQKFCNLFNNASHLALDYYYKDQSHLPSFQRDLLNYDSPDVLDFELFFKHLKDLKEGKDIYAPQYDFATHTRKKEKLLIKANDYIIVEGILIYHFKDVLPLFDYKIYVEADGDVRLARRLVRDVDERGREPLGVIKQFLTSVRPMHSKYVEPTKAYADAILINNGDSGIDDKELMPLLKIIKGV